MSEKTPEEKAAFKAKMAAAKAAKKAERAKSAASDGSTVVVEKAASKKPKAKKPKPDVEGSGGAEKKIPWHEEYLL